MSSQLTPDAAGLSVSVSPADVGRPGSLPQSSATPDLMNVSPLTEPAKSPSSSSALEEALKQREWLHSQKLQLTAQLNALESETNKDIDNLPESQLREMYEGLKDELLQKTVAADGKEHFLKGEMLNQTLLTVMATSQHPDADDIAFEQRRELDNLLGEYILVTSQLATCQKQKKKMQDGVEKVKKENFELIKKSRELSAEMDKLKLQKEEELRALVYEPGKESVYDQLDSKLNKMTLINNVTQGLILGSGVNWAQDEELCDLMIEAGQSVNVDDL